MGSRTPHVRLARRDCAPAPCPCCCCYRERTAGIEPASSVWKTDVSTQPHQIRTAADAGLEPALSDRESEGLPIAQSAVLSCKTNSPGPENRTRCVLLPKQAGQPAPSPRSMKNRPTGGTGGGVGVETLDALPRTPLRPVHPWL